MSDNIHYMLDLETLSTKPTACVLSIGIVGFTRDKILTTAQDWLSAGWEVRATPDNFLINGKSIFVTDVMDKADVELSTFKWWLDQSAEARKAVVNSSPIPLNQTVASMAELCNWVKFTAGVVWGNGASFDNVIFRNLCKRLGVECWNPFQDRCYRTWKQGKPALERRHGVYHDAHDDAVSQAQHMLEHGGFDHG